MLWTQFSLICQMLGYYMQFYQSIFWKTLAEAYPSLVIFQSIWPSLHVQKIRKKQRKKQLSVRLIQDLFSIFKNQSEKIFHSLVLAEPLRKQENPSAKFSIRWYYLKTWSVKPGLQQLTKKHNGIASKTK